jgi:hypothetical protein
MNTETIDKLFLELAQFTQAKPGIVVALERMLRRQIQSHESLAICLRGPPTEAGLQSCIKQCDQMAKEGNGFLD